jgi:hypothetical protein
MTWSCGELFTQEMAAACLQAEAALRAGEAQAHAAHMAGMLTLAAGGLALLAAIIGTYVSHKNVTRQIASARELQDAERKYVVKRDVYLNVASGLYSGMMAVSRLSDVRIPVDEALQMYYLEGSKISQIYIVAPLNVLNDVMPAIAVMSQTHMALITERMALQSAGRHIPGWGIHCLGKINSLILPLSKAVTSMRSDLELPIDRQAFEDLISKVMTQTTAQAEETLRGMDASRRS